MYTPLPASFERQINTPTVFLQDVSAMIAFTDGRYLVTWESEATETSSAGVHGHIIDSSKASLRGDFLIGAIIDEISVAALPDQGFVVSYTLLGFLHA